jgi:hypothetical protein
MPHDRKGGIVCEVEQNWRQVLEAVKLFDKEEFEKRRM